MTGFWVVVILGVVAVLAGYFWPREPKGRSLRRVAQDAEIAQTRHGRWN